MGRRCEKDRKGDVFVFLIQEVLAMRNLKEEGEEGKEKETF
jgi:hypothetical protein